MTAISETFFNAYVECALWASVDESDEPLDSGRDASDVAAETLASMLEDCADFQTGCAALLARAYEHPGYTEERAGHDFWLTRNGHGAGFWDRGLGDVGRALTDAAHVYGEACLYVGDDGMVHS